MMRINSNRHLWCMVVGAMFVVVGGCSDLRVLFSGVAATPAGQQVTQEELREKLEQFEDLFEAVVRRAGDELVQADNTRRTKRLTLIWQMRLLPMAQDAVSQENPLGGLLDVWSLCVRMRLYFTEGDGKALFGPHQQLAVQAARDCEKEIEKIAATILTSQMLAEARKRVTVVASEHPLRGEFSGAAVQASLQTSQDDPVLQNILAIPLTPFRWLGGVDKSAQAIKGFTVVAARLTDVVQGLAADARLQTQLLLLETEDLDTVKSTVASLERVSKSSERLVATTEKLPAELGRELKGVLDNVDAKQAGLQKTVTETKELVERLDPAGKSVAGAGDAWAGTAKAIEEMVASFRRPAPGSPGAPGPTTRPAVVKETPPYDINDYRRTAEALTQTAKEMQVLIAELRGLTESDAVAKRLEEMSKSFDSVLSESTDRATWRAIQVALIILGLAIAYRVVAVRYIRPRA
jgi:hypothetical protein